VPFANHRGQRIHYTVDGAGPLVVLLQGILLDASCWKRTGIVEALTDNYRVACVDSLGHGLSDKPSHPALYDQAQRAGDITAVIDDVGCERAHLVGHSMGGWLAVGLAKYHPKRLLSLVVGGWDLLNGLPKGKNGPLSFDSFMAFARRTAPGLVAWITPESEPGVRACFDALSELRGAREAVLDVGVPVLLWNGRDDSYHDPMQAFAAATGLPFLATAGDHLGMLFIHGAEGAKGIRGFLDGVEDATPP
jgi:pimeloyl-ACP methyl ester carboxylesterase